MKTKPAPGRELDALIATKVMGWHYVDRLASGYVGTDTDNNAWVPLPNYSTDIAAAWLVVERIHERVNSSTTGTPTYLDLGCRGVDWWATFGDLPHTIDEHSVYIHADFYEDYFLDDPPAEINIGDIRKMAIGETAAHAICLAALKIVTKEKEFE